MLTVCVEEQGFRTQGFWIQGTGMTGLCGLGFRRQGFLGAATMPHMAGWSELMCSMWEQLWINVLGNDAGSMVK